MTRYEVVRSVDGQYDVRAQERERRARLTKTELRRYVSAILHSGDARCALTGAPLDPSDCHADHVVPFEELADEVVASVGGLDAIPIVPSADGVTVHPVADGVVKETWRAFHRERAVLRLVTARANLSRRRGDA